MEDRRSPAHSGGYVPRQRSSVARRSRHGAGAGSGERGARCSQQYRRTEGTAMTENARVALVTGAASGIGRQLVLDLARRGWEGAGLDRDGHGLRALETALRESGHAFVWDTADVTDVATLRAAVASLHTRRGPIDLLVACAGIAGETPAVGMDPAAISRLISINLIGVSNTIAAVLPGMLARRRGHVVAISSLASLHGLPGQMGYCASKAGLNGLMQSLALDVRSFGIHVTT